MNSNSSPSVNDLTYTVDVSDTSEHSSGTSKKATIAQIFKAGNITIDGTNVGIASISPGAALDVVGEVRATSLSGDGSGITGIPGVGDIIVDTAYGSDWNNDTTNGASRNSLYDKFESLSSSSGSITINTTSPLTGGAVAATTFNLGLNQAQLTLSSIGGSVTDSQVPNTVTIDLATAASALASNPSACSSGEFVSDIAANGTLTCSVPSSSTGGWTDGGTTIYPTTSTDGVGIGTVSAVGRLTIKGQNAHYVGCSDSISSAVTAASSGDTIYLGSCTYSISSTISFAKALNFIGMGKKKTIIDAGTSSIGFLSSTADGLRVSDLTVKGTRMGNVFSIDLTGTTSTDGKNNIFDNIEITAVDSSDTTTGINLTDTGAIVTDSEILVGGTNWGTGQSYGIKLDMESTTDVDVYLYIKNTRIENTSFDVVGDTDAIIRGVRFYNFGNDDNPHDMYLNIDESSIRVIDNSSPHNAVEAVHMQGERIVARITNSTLHGFSTNGTNHQNKLKDFRCDDGAACYFSNTAFGGGFWQEQDGTVYREGYLFGQGMLIDQGNQDGAASSGVDAKAVFQVRGATGGDASGTISATAGEGALVSVISGVGGSATAATSTGTAGNGGAISFTTGAGGPQTSATSSTNVGGVAGALSLLGGSGGAANSASGTNTGGAGGSVYLRGGVGGVGTTTSGADGNVHLAINSAGTQVGKVQIGSTSSGSRPQLFNVVGASYFSGNVGIGSLSPAAKLAVVGTVNATAFVGDGSGLTGISGGGGGTGIGTINPGAVGAIPKYTTSQTVDDSIMFEGGSNIGISTTGPREKLEVNGNVRATTFIGALTGNSSTTTALAANGSNASAGNAILGVDASGVAEGSFDVLTQAELIDEDSFSTNSDTRPPSQQSTKAYVDAQVATVNGAWTDGGTNIYNTATSDNVGIGTTTPTSGLKLDVRGNIGFQSLVGIGTTQTQLSFLEATSNGSNLISFTAPSAVTSDVNCVLENDGNPIPDSCVGDGTDDGGSASPGGATQQIQFNNAGSFDGAPLLYYASGNVGIGTTRVADQLSLGSASQTRFNTNGQLTRFGGTTVVGDNQQWLMANAGGSFTVGQSSSTSSSGTILVGSAATNGTVNIKSTSGTGSGDFVRITGGTNGASEIARFHGHGGVGIGTTLTPTGNFTVMSGNVGIGTWSPTGQFALKNAASHAGQTACWTTNGVIGYCTTIVGAGGDCTCSGL